MTNASALHLRAPTGFVSIAELAERLGVSHRALRHYEELGLVGSNRHFSNTRHYDDKAVATLSVVASLRKAGVPIPKIRSIIALRDDTTAYLQAIRETLAEMAERKERDLATLRDLLGDLESVFAPAIHDTSAL